MAYCPGCANQNPDTAQFCAACGMSLPQTGYNAAAAPPQYPGPNPYGPPQPQMYNPYGPPGYVQPRNSGMAIAGFILSFFCSLLGLIFSIIGLNQVKNSGGMIKGGGFAVAGIIISIVNFIVGIMIAVANS